MSFSLSCFPFFYHSHSVLLFVFFTFFTFKCFYWIIMHFLILSLQSCCIILLISLPFVCSMSFLTCLSANIHFFLFLSTFLPRFPAASPLLCFLLSSCCTSPHTFPFPLHIPPSSLSLEYLSPVLLLSFPLSFFFITELFQRCLEHF